MLQMKIVLKMQFKQQLKSLAQFTFLLIAQVSEASKTVGRDGAHPLDIFKIVIDVNLVGTFNTLRLAAEVMGKNEPESDNECGVIILSLIHI